MDEPVARDEHDEDEDPTAAASPESSGSQRADEADAPDEADEAEGGGGPGPDEPADAVADVPDTLFADLLEDGDADDDPFADDQFGDDALDDEPRRNALPRRMESWRSRTATGAVISAMAMGLRQVFEPERRKPAIIAEAPGDPYDDDDPVVVDYVADDASGTKVILRPWLMQGADEPADPDGGT